MTFYTFQRTYSKDKGVSKDNTFDITNTDVIFDELDKKITNDEIKKSIH